MGRQDERLDRKGIDRRRLLKRAASFLGCVADPKGSDDRVIFSVCLACNARCGIRAVVKDGRLTALKGNPYHPYNMLGQPLSYGAPLSQALSDQSATVCAKAIDSISYVYSPYRVLVPLKRAGKRGEGRFEPISWDQLIEEISKGGRLFAHLGEDRDLPGLAELDSDEPVDPSDPGLGPKRNAFVFISGRMQHGRKAFIDRFVKQAFGSRNRIGHTDICGLGFRMGNFTMTEGKQVEMKADPWEAEYILVFGANIYSALQPGVNTYGAAVAMRSSKGRLRFSVVDPRGHAAVSHASRWVAVRPGHDAALAMGMMRWMIENGAINHDYLSAPNLGAAQRLGNGAYCNASHLVIVEPGHKDEGRFLRLSHLMRQCPAGEEQAFVVLDAGAQGEMHLPVHFEKTARALYDAEALLMDANGKGIRVKSAFRLLKESVFQNGLSEYATISGVDEEEIASLAKEFSSYGPRAAVCQYHGAGNYVGGSHASYAIALLNVLVGSVETRGGYMSGGGQAGGWRDGFCQLGTFPGARRPKGVAISREKARYEESLEFRKRGYPAKRPWFPFTKGGLCVETMAGIDEAYPYGCKVLFTYFFNPVYSIPGGYRFIDTLEDPDKVPLHVSIDIGINESNIYADYIVPDVTFAEGHYGWLAPHAPAQRFTALRTPVIEPLTGKTRDGRPFCLETFLIDLALALDLPGFGKGAIPSKEGDLDLFRAEEFYLRGMANIVLSAGVPEATGHEIGFVQENYPVAQFRDLLPRPIWRRLCYALARGGIFLPREGLFSGNSFLHGVKRVVLYNERLSGIRNSLDGSRFSGTVELVLPADSQGQNLIERDKREFPFTLVTHKLNIHTQSRTIWHRIARQIMPENHVYIHEADAAALGIGTGDLVRVSSRSTSAKGGVVGRAKVGPMIRRGCIAISNHYGHSQLGASPLRVGRASEVFLGGPSVAKADRLLPDPSLGRGINSNFVTNLDPALANTPMVDLLGGIPDFSSTQVRIQRISG